MNQASTFGQVIMILGCPGFRCPKSLASRSYRCLGSRHRKRVGSLITLSQEVLVSLTLVLLAALISRWQSLDLEKQMLVAVVRAFIQLTLICFALTYIFDVDRPCSGEPQRAILALAGRS